MAKRGRPTLQLTAGERLERRRAQLTRSQRKSRARRRDTGGCCCASFLPISPRQCVPPQDSTAIMAAPTSSAWQQLGFERLDMNPQPPESHRDNFSRMEAEFDNSPASPDLNILERSESHVLSRVLESAEHESHAPIGLDTIDPSVFLPNSDSCGCPLAAEKTPNCGMLPGSDSICPAMLDTSFCAPTSTFTSAQGATLFPLLLPEEDLPDSLLYTMPVLDPSFNASQGENDHISPEHNHWTMQESLTDDLVRDDWASPTLVSLSDGLALDAGLSDGYELETTMHPFKQKGLDDCRTVQLFSTFAV